MISFNKLAKSATGLALAMQMTLDGAEGVPIAQDSRLSNLSSQLQDALDFDQELLPYDDYNLERIDDEGHYVRKTVHKHKEDDGIDIEFETNENPDPIALMSYLMENMPKAVTTEQKAKKERHDQILKNRHANDGQLALTDGQQENEELGMPRQEEQEPMEPEPIQEAIDPELLDEFIPEQKSTPTRTEIQD